MTDQELIRLQWYNLKDVKELSLSQLEDYQDLLSRQLVDLENVIERVKQ